MSIIWLRQGKELSERRWKVASWIPNKVQTPSELYWILYIELLEIEDKAEDVLKKPYDLDGSLHFSRG